MYKQTMNKKKILFLGYSSFLQRRVLPAVKKFKNLQISICSKSSKINTDLLITENNYIEAIKKKPYLVYISLVNNMHFKYALLSLKNNCHVIVDKAWLGRLEPASDEEADLLDLAVGLTPTSRLGCQIVITEALNGLEVTLPYETDNLTEF